MVATSWLSDAPPAMPPVDGDDSVLLSHPVHELLDDRSWTIDNRPSAVSEDDSLQKEIDMLPSAERRVSQEICDLVQLFSDMAQKNTANKETKRGPRNFYSRISPMGSVHTELTKREDSFVVQQKKQVSSTINNETKRWERRRMSPVDSPNVQEIITMFTRDVRESPGLSQPSDEKSNGIFGVSTREPPEEILFVEEDGLHITSTDMDENDWPPGLEEKTSLQYRVSLDELSFVEEHEEQMERAALNAALSYEEEQEFAALSEWCLRSGQLVGLAKGETDLFEEESFWEGSFWKTPEWEPTSKGSSAKDKRHQLPKSEVLETRSMQDIVAALSLPKLDKRRDEVRELQAQTEWGSIRLWGEQLLVRDTMENRHIEQVDADPADIEQAHTEQRDVLNRMAQPKESTTPKSILRKSPRIFSNWTDNRLASRIRSKVKSHAYAGLDKESVNTIEQPDVEQPDVEHANFQPEESTTPKSRPWILSPSFSHSNDNQQTLDIQSKVKSHAQVLPTTLPDEGGRVEVEKEMISQRVNVCNWRAVVLLVHTVFTISGGAIFIIFFR